MKILAYLQSNEPYQRVDNGVWGGILAGSSIALAGAGATDFALSRLPQTKTSGISIPIEGGTVNTSPEVMRRLSEEDKVRIRTEDMNVTKHPTRASQLRSRMFGNSRAGRLARYAGYGLAGGAIGGTIDFFSED